MCKSGTSRQLYTKATQEPKTRKSNQNIANSNQYWWTWNNVPALHLLRFIWYAVNFSSSKYSWTHTHTHTYIYIYKGTILTEWFDSLILHVLVHLTSSTYTLSSTENALASLQAEFLKLVSAESYNSLNQQMSPEIHKYQSRQKSRRPVKNIYKILTL